MLRNPSTHQHQSTPSSASRYLTPHTNIHGANQNLLNPAASPGYAYVPRAPQQPQTTPQQANQGLLNPSIPPAQQSTSFSYQQQQPQHPQQPAQYSTTQIQNLPQQNVQRNINPATASYYA